MEGAAPGVLIEVYEATGRRVAQQSADAAGTAQLRLPTDVAPGIYLVRSGTQSCRLIVE
ncbi:hypothetical protein [Hymenobacter metallicola]|uniref:hypothetical protein n=1 Tax=Hymenobacter metallicola TaxID=2563114 RepID=UPI0014367FDA|nr:hypothetical protein [Hymenobacter metallicola]